MHFEEHAQVMPALDILLHEFQQLEPDDPGRTGMMLEIGNVVITLSRERTSDTADNSVMMSADDTATTVVALEVLGRHLADQSMYAAALECFVECIRMQDAAPDPIIVGAAWMEMGVIYGEMIELDRALECFESSAGEFGRGGNYYLEVKATSNVARILRMKGNGDLALPPTLRCLAVYEALDDRQGIIESLAELGRIYQQMGKVTGAIGCTRRAAEMLAPEENPVLKGTLMVTLGNLHRTGNNPAEALANLDAARDLLNGNPDPRLHARLHESMSLVFEQLNDPTRALEHHRKAVAFDNEHWNNRQQSNAAELQIRFEMKQVRSERDRYRHQAQELRQEVYAKTRELTSLSLMLVHKSEFLDEMRRQLGQVIDSSHTHSSGLVKPLLDDLIASTNSDDAWRVFEEQFNEVHRDFVRTIAERFPLLTPTELKICALTRFDLSTKEIAAILYVSVRNVQNHRYRIRKKFELDSEANLTSFLTAI